MPWEQAWLSHRWALWLWIHLGNHLGLSLPNWRMKEFTLRPVLNFRSQVSSLLRLLCTVFCSHLSPHFLLLSFNHFPRSSLRTRPEASIFFFFLQTMRTHSPGAAWHPRLNDPSGSWQRQYCCVFCQKERWTRYCKNRCLKPGMKIPFRILHIKNALDLSCLWGRASFVQPDFICDWCYFCRWTRDDIFW